MIVSTVCFDRVLKGSVILQLARPSTVCLFLCIENLGYGRYCWCMLVNRRRDTISQISKLKNLSFFSLSSYYL